MLAKGEAVFDNAGRTTRLLGVNTDITERKLAYATLSEWKSRYQAAVESSNQLLYDWDPHTNDVTYGGDLARMIGFSEEEMQGGLQRWMEQIHPDDRGAFQRRDPPCDRRGGLVPPQLPLLPQGRPAHLAGGPGPLLPRRRRPCLKDGRVHRGRKRADPQRSGAQELGGALLQGVPLQPDAIMILRRSDGRILEVNGTWETTFGYLRAEAVGRVPESLGLYPGVEDRERLERTLETAPRVADHEVDLRTRTGALLHATLSADTVEMAGEPCFITFVRDVTARKRAEAEAQEQRHQVAHLGRVAMLGELPAPSRTS